MNVSLDINEVPSTLQQHLNIDKVSVKDSSKTRRQWWQRTVVRRSLSSIEPDFENLVSTSPFLQKHLNDENHLRCIAPFHRTEIITGELLGRGGFSQVMDVVSFNLLPEISERCTAEEQALREQFARTVLLDSGTSRFCIKHLQERLIQKPKDFKLAASDLAIEAATLSSIEHENIVSVRGLPIDGLRAWKYGQHDGYFIVMDRLFGTLDKRLHEWKTNRAVTVTEKAEYALQLASALRYLHSNRLLYRDLKPQNIGFSADHKVKLFDFGLCRELPDGAPCEGVYDMSGVGTRRYMAPEIVNVGQYNQKADVYGLSMVFWEMLSLSKPYAPYSTDDHSLFVCKGGERPTLQLHWPYWIHSLLKFSWEESLEVRFTIDEVYECLQSALMTDHKVSNNELYCTNHEKVVSKEFSMPSSPIGVHDFPTTIEPESKALKLIDDSINHMPRFIDNITPPPAPRRPATTFVKVPNEVARTFELSLLDDKNAKMSRIRPI
jgi:serine/threonine protein kinase